MLGVIPDVDYEKLHGELVRDEGYRLTPYKDTLGNFTIGIGHLLLKAPLPGVWWPPEQVEKTFQQDVWEAYEMLADNGWYKGLDTDARRRALINMSFQLRHKLLGFHTFISYLGVKQWREAAQDLKTTKWFEQVPERAARIIAQITRG